MASNGVATEGKGQKVWVTVLTNAAYLVGVLTLNYSLHKVKSQYRLLVIYLDRVPPWVIAELGARGIMVQKVETLSPDIALDIKVQRFVDNWTKFRAFELTEYERVVLVDADMILCQNMDELMSIDVPRNTIAACHACVCNPLKQPYPSTWVPANCAFTAAGKLGSAVNRTQAVSNRESLSQLNSGLMIIQPSRDTFNLLISAMGALTKESDVSFAEQSLLSDVFAGKWVPLPYIYNALKTLKYCHTDLWDDNDVKCVHFIIDKPWDDIKENGRWRNELHQWWWDANHQRLLDELKSA